MRAHTVKLIREECFSSQTKSQSANFKTTHLRRVLDNKNHIRLGRTRQFVYSVSTQQRVSAQRAVIRLERE